VDFVRLRDIVGALPQTSVLELLEHQQIFLRATDDQETAVASFKKYDVTILPVIDGKGVIVSDDEILDAQVLGSSRAGLFAEPSSACALAGFIKARPLLGKDEVAVVMLTGSGLKDIKTAAKAVGYELK